MSKIDTVITGTAGIAASNAAAIATDTPNIVDTIASGSAFPDLSSAPGLVNLIVQTIIGVITIIKFFRKPKNQQ